mmetsp:Transcript_72281/g.233898  ORF Transcript_72281/g.233898 Transcript_72281/m.233898 type:complete len:246 (+) Transcript_72281:829-1566(+)
MVISKSSIFASKSCFSRSFFSVCNWFVLNSSTQKSLCLISSSFSFKSCAIMSSMAFFTFEKASNRTLYARVANRGLCNFLAAAASMLEACSRRSECPFAISSCKNAGLKVLLKRSCASSPLNTARALDTACISSWRVFWRSSHSLSVIWHFSFSIMRNSSSAASEARVSSMSSLACAFFASVSASSCVLVSICAWPAEISASFAAFKSSYAFWFAFSSFCESAKLDSNVSFICLKIPNISPDCGA